MGSFSIWVKIRLIGIQECLVDSDPLWDEKMLAQAEEQHLDQLVREEQDHIERLADEEEGYAEWYQEASNWLFSGLCKTNTFW